MSWIDRTLDRLYACGFGVKVIYVVRDPVEVKREFPNDAKYPRFVYAAGFILLTAAMISAPLALLWMLLLWTS